jgi:hypothetical protein
LVKTTIIEYFVIQRVIASMQYFNVPVRRDINQLKVYNPSWIPHEMWGEKEEASAHEGDIHNLLVAVEQAFHILYNQIIANSLFRNISVNTLLNFT